MAKKASIEIQIELDEHNVPEKIQWRSDDQPTNKELKGCKAFLLSLFDEETKDTLKIDLWTKEMQVVEMDRLFFQTLRALADTYFKATQNEKLASDMQKFVHYFGEETGIIPKQ